jgi:hypothetical protein
MSRKDSTRDFWDNHYQTFKTQKTTQREYCRANNLGYWSFNKWKKQFDSENDSTALQRVPITFQPAKTEKIEIILPGNIVITVPEHFSENTLKKIISVLRDKQ